ncbi:hypothetical protein AUP68_10335 [Ilyonectria robusta]
MSFQCPYPGCCRCYVRKEHLSRHQRDHSNLREFTCDHCTASFNRSDILNRHISLTHPSTRSGTSEDLNNQRVENADILDTQVEAERESSLFSPEEGIWPPISSTNALFCDTIHRSAVEDVYFQYFHPHWPILHQQTYRNTPQSPDLTRCVLVAGLWMAGTHQEEARKQHESLLRCLGHELSMPLQIFKKIPRELGPRNLALLQALLIPLILCTYIGPKTIPLSIIYIKNLFLALENAGIYDQATLDGADLDPIVEEQYRRLVLVHFKTFIHINSTLTEHFAMFKPFEYLHPSKLRVRAPSPLAAWNACTNPTTQSSDQQVLVSDLSKSNVSASLLYSELGPLLAWDFTTGMILGCFISQKSDEKYAAVLKRAQPFLFMHKKHIVIDRHEESMA